MTDHSIQLSSRIIITDVHHKFNSNGIDWPPALPIFSFFFFFFLLLWRTIHSNTIVYRALNDLCEILMYTRTRCQQVSIGLLHIVSNIWFRFGRFRSFDQITFLKKKKTKYIPTQHIVWYAIGTKTTLPFSFIHFSLFFLFFVLFLLCVFYIYKLRSCHIHFPNVSRQNNSDCSDVCSCSGILFPFTLAIHVRGWISVQCTVQCTQYEFLSDFFFLLFWTF